MVTTGMVAISSQCQREAALAILRAKSLITASPKATAEAR
jgi:hypothetical protein